MKKLLLAFALLLPSAAQAQYVTLVPSNFVWSPSLITSMTLMTTELQSIANTNVTSSSVNGSSGLFGAGNTGSGIWAQCYYNEGAPGLASPTAGANIAVWFLTSLDGTTFEFTSATSAPARAPDMLFPVPNGTIAVSPQTFAAAGLIRIPAVQFKVAIQNNTGVTLSSGAQSAPSIKCGTVAVQR